MSGQGPGRQAALHFGNTSVSVCEKNEIMGKPLAKS